MHAQRPWMETGNTRDKGERGIGNGDEGRESQTQADASQSELIGQQQRFQIAEDEAFADAFQRDNPSRLREKLRELSRA